MKKIFIIGNNQSSLALAKKMSVTADVFVTSNLNFIDFAVCVDIREDNIKELLDFVLENEIDLTIVVSDIAIRENIAEAFNFAKQSIFAPISKSAEIVYNKALAKKNMYKLRIPTPKFGIFDKENAALDYLKTQKMPCVLKTNDSNSAVVVTSYDLAKSLVNRMFIEKNTKIIVEDYVYGTPFSFYTITDGYKALPIGSSINYKYFLDGDGGQLTNGMGSVVPNYKLSIDQEYYLMDEVIYPEIEYLQMCNTPYVGVLGINGIITEEGNISILGWHSFMQNSDIAGILEQIDEDLYGLFMSCAMGIFSDETETIRLKNGSSATVVLMCRENSNNENVISGVENVSENAIVSYYPNVTKNRYIEYQVQSSGPVISVTMSASTAGNAVKYVYDEIKEIDFTGKYYRKDIK